MLAGYSAAIVVRAFDQAAVDQIAVSSDVPVVNARTDQHHPCQALADFPTLRERFGEIHGLRLAYIGDGGNVVQSLMEAPALSPASRSLWHRRSTNGSVPSKATGWSASHDNPEET